MVRHAERVAVRRLEHLLHPVGSLHRQPPQVVGDVAEHPQHLPGPRLARRGITGQDDIATNNPLDRRSGRQSSELRRWEARCAADCGFSPWPKGTPSWDGAIASI
ncbi:MAG: hypothetical protein RMJ19_02320 [Gemmatales bacterium]|nr:hypothetical protein [Gemmatales bacterium]MDW8174483.1 hypothetical protein [Gemmatales bacterium]